MENRNSNQKQNVSVSKNDKRSGQETMGKREQELDKKEKEHYHHDQTRKKGTHGGNR